MIHRKTRLLTDDELAPWAIKRGEWNDEPDKREGLILAYVAAAFVGGGLWVLIVRAVWAALTGPDLGDW